MTFRKEELHFIPLGGSEQFGVNLNVYGTAGKWLAVDCGMGFADQRFPGIDVLLPDPSFLEERAEDLVGLVITHAHEDHIGAVAHLWPRLKCPIYCAPFTAAVLRMKLSENPACRGAKVTEVDPMQPLDLGPFGVSFVPVTHSVPETAMLFIETKAGTIVHSGDWNLDPAPTIGEPVDPQPFMDLGKKGVLAFISDSTNAEVEGVSGSEGDVEKGLEALFTECAGRIAITMFASNIGRLRSIALAARATGRRVALVGRSLHRMVSAARECGYLEDILPFMEEKDILACSDREIVLVVTGSQGEARAQMARIARGDHPDIRFKRGDTVIFSARAIPGNEREIIAVKNNLAASHVRIISPRDTDHVIHVSGHPARDEIRKMLSWLTPQCVVAVHGERTMLEANAQLALAFGVPEVIVPNNGSVIRLFPHTPQIVDHVETGLLAVEPARIIAADHEAIAQRRKLQFSGAVHVTIVLDSHGDLAADPIVSTVGLVDPASAEGRSFEEGLEDEVEAILEDMTRRERGEDLLIEKEIHTGLRRLVRDMLSLKPKTTVHLVRV